MNVMAVVPALNEEEAIGGVVRDLIGAGIHQVIVVDNASADRTSAEAQAAGATVVSQPERGYGAACIAGVDAAARADIVVFLDGDATEVIHDLGDMIRAVAQGPARLALGARTRQRESLAMPWQQRFGNHLLASLASRLTGVRLTDLPSLKVVDGETLRTLNVRDRRYGWTAELITRAAMRRYAIVEFPRGSMPRKGRSKVTGSPWRNLRVGWAIAATIVRVWKEERRTRRASAR